MQATADNNKAARLVGLRVERVHMFTFGVSAAIAGAVATLMAPLTLLYPDIGFGIFIKGFAAAVLGGLTSIPGEGLLCWSVPGCVAGWEDLRARFGSKPLAEILAPAIAYAEEGFPVSEIIAGGWRGSAKHLAAWPDTAKTYLPGGNAPASPK